MSITLWSLLGSLACAIWSAQLTHTNDYNQFVVSRLLSGMFGSIPSAFGGGIILDVFFLHNRGRAFISYEVSVLLGATAGPTFSGFISNSHSWTLCFWWTVPLLVISALVVLFFGEETGYDRERGAFPVKIPHNYVANRVATFLPGTAIVAKSSTSKFVRI
jgi:MFS family permease